MGVKHAWRRGLALGLVLAFGFFWVLVRIASAPTSDARHGAMAPGPDGGVLVAGRGGTLTLLDSRGARRAVGLLPTHSPLALASSGQRLLLGAEDGLFESPDAGQTWRQPLPIKGRFTAVALAVGRAAAGSWGQGLWVGRDNGSWIRAQVPAGDTEFESIVLADPGPDLAATELGLLRSRDGGHGWERIQGLPNRITALYAEPGLVEAGTWSGDVFLSSDGGRSWLRSQALGTGVWAVAGSWVATSTGLFDRGHRVAGILGRRETTQLVVSSGDLYAATASGPIYALRGDRWRQVYKP